MNSFYNETELQSLGFKKIGDNILLSKKASIYGVENIILGDNVRIDDFCILSGQIVIGSFIHIAAYSAIYGADVGVYIDDFANISSRVSIYAISDDYSGKFMTNPMIDENYKSTIKGKVVLEKHVIVGSTSVILPGVTLKEGSAFGCFSLINKDSEMWSINAGIPCKKIKDRSKDLLEIENDFLKDRI